MNMLWRLVDAGEILQPGDQWWSHDAWQWMPVTESKHGFPVAVNPSPVRRRMQDEEARREYDAALPGLLRKMGIAYDDVESAP